MGIYSKDLFKFNCVQITKTLNSIMTGQQSKEWEQKNFQPLTKNLNSSNPHTHIKITKNPNGHVHVRNHRTLEINQSDLTSQISQVNYLEFPRSGFSYRFCGLCFCWLFRWVFVGDLYHADFLITHHIPASSDGSIYICLRLEMDKRHTWWK